MEKKLEIRWHGRGGQGVKTIAQFLAELSISIGLYGQGFPEFGPERTGAPVQGYNKISDEPIESHTRVENPDIVIVLDETLLTEGNITEGLKNGGILLINTTKTKEEIQRKLNISNSYNIHTVDATGISLKILGKNIPNTVMLGALIKLKPIFELDKLFENLKHRFSRKFSEKVIQGNIDALKRAYEEVK